MTASASSIVERLASLTPAERADVLDGIGPREREALLYAWPFWARPSQRAPAGNDWSVWLILSGRGWGKSLTAAHWIRECVDSGEARSVGLIGPSLQEIRDNMLGEGRDERGSGLLTVWPPEQRPKWEASKRRVTFHTGAVATIFSAEESELRGPNFSHVWADECAKWKYLEPLWANLEMASRRPGATPPRILVTTTPRPLPLLRELKADPFTRVVVGSTFENAANLSPQFLARMKARYAGTRLGRQELYGEILDDLEDALFRQADIDRARVHAAPELRRIVIAVDPAVSTGRSSDETGIIVCGAADDRSVYVLEDLSGRYAPEVWAAKIVAAHDRWRARCDSFLVVAETSRGGDLVQSNLRARRASLPIALVRATKGKDLRAEPVATLYARGVVRHVAHLPALEEQLVEFNPRGGGPSPDRVDALVYAVTELADLEHDDLGDFDAGAFERANAELAHAGRGTSLARSGGSGGSPVEWRTGSGADYEAADDERGGGLGGGSFGWRGTL